MSDLSAVAFFLSCLGLSFGFVRACDWLRPRDSGPASGPSGDASGTGVRR